MTIQVESKTFATIRSVLIESLAFVQDQHKDKLMLTVATDHESQHVKYINSRLKNALDLLRKIKLEDTKLSNGEI